MRRHVGSPRASTPVLWLPAVVLAAVVVLLGCGGRGAATTTETSAVDRTTRPSGSSASTTDVTAATTSTTEPAAMTAARLQDVEVPPLCGHPGGRLVNGSLPGLPEGQGFVTISTAEPEIALGELDGRPGGDAAAIVRCSQGGVGLPDSVQIYSADGDHVASLEFEDFDEGSGSRDVAEGLQIVDGRLIVRWATVQAIDAACCPTRKVEGTFRLEGGALVADGLTVSGEVPAWTRYDEGAYQVMEDLLPAWIRGDDAALDLIPMDTAVRQSLGDYPGVAGQISCDAVDSSARSDNCYVLIIEDETDDSTTSGEYVFDFILDPQVGWKVTGLRRSS